jgi:hypothetical protein
MMKSCRSLTQMKMARTKQQVLLEPAKQQQQAAAVS